MKVYPTIEGAITTAGITLFLCFVGSVMLLRHSPFDTGQREGAFGAMAASAWMTIIWVAAVAGVAVMRWRATGNWFRAVFLLNAVIVGLLLSDLWTALRAG